MRLLLMVVLLLACGDNDNKPCTRPKGLHTFDGRLQEQGPVFNCDILVTDTVNFDADPCIQNVTFDDTTCVWEGRGECSGGGIYFRVDDYPTAFLQLSVDGVPLCAYDVEIRP